MELWGVLWGSTVAIAEAGYSLLGGVVLFLMSLLLTGLFVGVANVSISCSNRYFMCCICLSFRCNRQDGVHEHLRVGHIRSCGELHDLWAIDNDAYGEASIAYDKFEDWWRGYPFGLHALFFRTRVMGAIGIWPLSTSCAGLLKAARLKESEITGRQMRVFRDAPARYWYVSGIVLRPELIGGRAIKILLSHGVGSWLASAHIQFPCELLALAYSDQGQALLGMYFPRKNGHGDLVN